jgi:hypothetical protein
MPAGQRSRARPDLSPHGSVTDARSWRADGLLVATCANVGRKAVAADRGRDAAPAGV